MSDGRFVDACGDISEDGIKWRRVQFNLDYPLKGTLFLKCDAGEWEESLYFKDGPWWDKPDKWDAIVKSRRYHLLHGLVIVAMLRPGETEVEACVPPLGRIE